MKILIADDEADIRRVLSLLLTDRGYEVVEAADGEEAVQLAGSTAGLDLIIMDMMMPRLGGVEATEKIRAFSTVPVLFLTAKSLSRDKAMAYTAGGDDYLVKPFEAAELLMKIEALTRRYTVYNRSAERSPIIALACAISVDLDERTVTKSGAPIIGLRDKETDMLIYLAKNRGRAVSPTELYEAVWNERALPSASNTVTVHILNLRRRLEDTPSSPRLIRTVWGKGYQID